jgi:NAD(P)H-dependent FMN reductase
MTAKEQLLERVASFSEQEAADTLRLLDRRADPVARFFDDAPLEDEPISAEEEAAVEEAREEIARGETIPLEELLAELDE